jgi:Cu-Zn family superoxide dismutase
LRLLFWCQYEIWSTFLIHDFFSSKVTLNVESIFLYLKMSVVYKAFFFPHSENALIDYPGLEGTVFFYQATPHHPVEVQWDINGLMPNSEHGMHIHEKSIQPLLNEGDTGCCDQAGGHFNPTDDVHGRHYGDLCFNIETNAYGVSKGRYMDSNLNLYVPVGTKYSILGRSVVLHADPDNRGILNQNTDSESLKTGRAGKRLGCANIIC